MTRLVLQHAHTHAGTTYPVGTRLLVAAPDAEWLLAHGIARLPTNAPKTAPAPKSSLPKDPNP